MTNTRNTQSATRSRIRLSGSTALAGFAKLVLLGLGGSLALASAHAQSLPTGGTVTAGAATISNGAGTVTIDQSSQATAINWYRAGQQRHLPPAKCPVGRA
jgi:hypothetical protein